MKEQPPYLLGNAFAQRMYEEQLRSSIAESTQSSSSATKDAPAIKTTTLEIPAHKVDDGATPGTSMDLVAPPVTENGRVAEAARTRQRDRMLERARTPSKSPVRRPLNRRRSTTSRVAAQTSKTPRPEIARGSTDTGASTLFNKMVPKVLRGKKSRGNLQPSAQASHFSGHIDTTLATAYMDRNKPLPTLYRPVYTPPSVPSLNLQSLPYPSSSPRAPSPSTASLRSQNSPSLDPKASPFRPGQQWPPRKGSDFVLPRKPNPLIIAPPNNATSEALGHSHAHPPRWNPKSPTPSNIAGPYSSPTRSSLHQTSPTPPPRKHTLLHSEGMITSTMGPATGADGGDPQYITPMRSGSYAITGKAQVVHNDGIPMGVSMKGSILHSGESIVGKALQLGDLDEVSELEAHELLPATVYQPGSTRKLVVEAKDEAKNVVQPAREIEQSQSALKNPTIALEQPPTASTTDTNGHFFTSSTPTATEFATAAANAALTHEPQPAVSPTSIYSPYPPALPPNPLFSGQAQQTQFNNLHAHITQLEQRLTLLSQQSGTARLDTKLNSLLNTIDQHIRPRVETTETQLNLLDDRLNGFEARLEDVEVRFRGVETKLDSLTTLTANIANDLATVGATLSRLVSRVESVDEKLDRWSVQARIEESFRGGRYPGQERDGFGHGGHHQGGGGGSPSRRGGGVGVVGLGRPRRGSFRGGGF
ncbi:uncharacterized protein AB675_7191 [Cyphellophora attinorum]|uniref:Uncharacterized protein n=1 Tax=Cyphellophora attinorum TaxID=1664694 RepID=A0A0N1GXM6_9EURO|nr:uncharacterized protein AB675_7191 [Phialophora attinorum]KPI35055.1 hypothetical protein AB675_7191 [Phialophora attinorum]